MTMPLNDSEYRFQPPPISDLLASPFASLLAGGVQPEEALRNVMQKFATVPQAQAPATPRPNYDQNQLDAIARAFGLSGEAIAQQRPVQMPERRLSPMRPGETGLVALAGLLGRALGVDNRTLEGLGQGYVGTRQAQADQEYQRQMSAAQAEQLVQQRRAQMLQNEAQKQMALANVFGDRAKFAEEQSGKERIVGMQIGGDLQKALLGGNIESALQDRRIASAKELETAKMLYSTAASIANPADRVPLFIAAGFSPETARFMASKTVEQLTFDGNQLEQQARIKQMDATTASIEERIAGDRLTREIMAKYGMDEARLNNEYKQAQLDMARAQLKMVGSGRSGGGGRASLTPQESKLVGLAALPRERLEAMKNALDWRMKQFVKSLGTVSPNTPTAAKTIATWSKELVEIQSAIDSKPRPQMAAKPVNFMDIVNPGRARVSG